MKRELRYTYLLEYMIKCQERLEFDYATLMHRLRQSNQLDNIDYILMIEANVRLQTAGEIFSDIFRILKGFPRG